ncbi:MAG: hypothetical protein Q9197_001137 [Variospora fuerteventurae]
MDAELAPPPLRPSDGHVFRPLADDGLYEHFLVRRHYLNLFQGIFSTYPVQDEFPTQDVYRKHPTKPGLWRFAGRVDDVIVFSNAEKFYPDDFEDTISSHPAVRTTVMGGHGEFQSCLLIEPMQAVDGSDGNAALLDEVWPKIQEANKTIPSHAEVVKDFILFVSPEKPVEHAGTGPVQRTATLQLYLEEIASLYKAPEMPKIDPHQIVQSELQQASTLGELISKSVEYDGRIKDDTDFSDLGLDSLQTLALSKKINAYLMQADSAAPTATPYTIYAHSSIGRLTSALEFTIVPLPTWLVELEARIEAGGLKAEIPAQSLLEFVRGTQTESGGYLDITKASEKSRTLAEMEIIGYTFNDPTLVWEAVSAAGSFTSGGNRQFADGNKRLAVLGDTVLQLALAEHWYDGTGVRGKRHPGLNSSFGCNPAKKASGVYDDIRQQVGSNANLSIVGRTANIDAFVNLSGAQRTVAPLTMAVTVEAILGAVYLDSKGIAAVKAVMEKLGLKPA